MAWSYEEIHMWNILQNQFQTLQAVVFLYLCADEWQTGHLPSLELGHQSVMYWWHSLCLENSKRTQPWNYCTLKEASPKYISPLSFWGKKKKRGNNLIDLTRTSFTDECSFFYKTPCRMPPYISKQEFAFVIFFSTDFFFCSFKKIFFTYIYRCTSI